MQRTPDTEKAGATAPSFFSRLFKPHTPRDSNDILLRCSCGDLFWKTGANVRDPKHLGHRMQAASEASFFEVVKLKLGLIR